MHTNAYTYVLCMNASENQNPSTPPHHLLQTLHSGLPERRRLRPVQRLRTAMHTYIQPTLQNKVRRLNGQLFVVFFFSSCGRKGLVLRALGLEQTQEKLHLTYCRLRALGGGLPCGKAAAAAAAAASSSFFLDQSIGCQQTMLLLTNIDIFLLNDCGLRFSIKGN